MVSPSDTEEPHDHEDTARMARMKSAFRNFALKLRGYFVNEEVFLSRWNAEMMADFYSYNLSLCMTAAAMLCDISLIGLIGTYSPHSTGYILPVINAPAVYLVIFCTNALFLAAMHHASRHGQSMELARIRRLCHRGPCRHEACDGLAGYRGYCGASSDLRLHQ